MFDFQFNSVQELLHAFPTEQACIDYLETVRWSDKDNIQSPFDPTSKVYKCKNNRYHCKNTGKYFNVRTGTFLESSKINLQTWFLAIWYVTIHKKGISSVQLAIDLNVTQKTAWFITHRIRECFSISEEENINDNKLGDHVEIDETFVGGKNKNRHTSKKIPNSQGRSVIDKTPVLGILQREGYLVATVVPDTKGETLMPEIIKNVHTNATVCTDEWLGYKNLKNFFKEHLVVKHYQGEYVVGNAHTNSIEGFWAIFKRGIIGIYHALSRKHLQRYVNEFVFRYNTRKMEVKDKFDLLLKNMVGSRLRWRELVKNC